MPPRPSEKRCRKYLRFLTSSMQSLTPCYSVSEPRKALLRQRNNGAPILTACTRRNRWQGITIGSLIPDQHKSSRPQSSGSIIHTFAGHVSKCRRTAGHQTRCGATSAVLATSAGSTPHELLFVLTTLYSIAVLFLVGCHALHVVNAIKEHRQSTKNRLHLRSTFRFLPLK